MKTLPEERHPLVLDNIALVDLILRKNFRHYLFRYYEDLHQEGCLGLIKAAMYFDESRGKFSTYAGQFIDGYVRRYVREKLTLIKMPRNLVDIQYLVWHAVEQGMTIEEITSEYEIDSKHTASIIALKSINSIEETVFDSGKGEGQLSFADMLSEETDYYEEYILEDSFLKCIQDFTSTIRNEKHRHLYEEYLYSNLYYDKITQEELAKKYGITQSFANRIINSQSKRFRIFLKKNLID